MNTNAEDLVAELVKKLKVTSGVKAIVLGGSRADDTNRPDSDFDIGIYYNSQVALDLVAIKNLANEVNEIPDPTFTSIGEWGKWVNGGAWLAIKGERVDFLYRDLDFVSKIIQDCQKGLRQSDFYQQPPFGFHSYIYCAEIQICKVLFDPECLVSNLKQEVIEYPAALKRTIIKDFLWDAEFSLSHAKKSAERGEPLIVAGCLIKIASDLVQVLYAINEVFFISEKKLAKQEITFRIKPPDFLPRLNRILSHIGDSTEEMSNTVIAAVQLFDEMVKLAGGLYKPKFKY